MTRVPPPPGLLAVDKPAGPTSRDVVDLVCRALGTRRVGHAGTLDPFARGVVLVAWGKATGLVPYLQEYPKSYLARVRFGVETDTQDRTGAVLAERDPGPLTEASVAAALEPFRGVILQVPPMYSALKQDGERLYRRARRGETVAREPRERRVDRLDLVAWDPPRAELQVVCSAGTYVRTLAHDLGRSLGPGAHLEALTRTAVGPYRLEDALPAARIPELGREVILARSVDPARALPDWPRVVLPPEEAREVRHGSWRDPRGVAAAPTPLRILDEEGRLLAVARGGRPPRLLRVLAPAGEDR